MEYKFPIDLPRFTDEEMKQRKEKYVAEHGYYISAPKLSDIIHVRYHKEPDEYEWKEFKSGRLRTSNPHRYGEIEGLLANKRRRAEQILASPSPTWLSNVGSVMTFMDDVNDFAGTAAVVCRIAARFAPRILSKFFLGPAGWLLLIADIFSLVMTLSRLPISCMVGKRHFEKVGELNPFSKAARATRAKKLRRVLPGKGEIIEALQVTDQLFGIGLCLGPLVGFAQDIVTGTVRTIKGQPVHWHSPPPRPRSHEQNAARVLRFAQTVGLAHDEFSEEDHWLINICLNGATQVYKPYRDIWDPFDQVDGMENVLFEAPKVNRETTKFILRELGVDPDKNYGWPGLDKKEATAEDLWNYYQKPAAKGFYDFGIRNRQNMLGMTGAQNGWEFAKNMLLLTEGYETVEEEYREGWDGWYAYFSNGCVIDDWPMGFRMGSYRSEGNYYRVGDKILCVHCSCLPPRRKQYGRARTGMYMKTRTCNIWLDINMCRGKCKDHVFGYLVERIDARNLEHLRRGVIPSAED